MRHYFLTRHCYHGYSLSKHTSRSICTCHVCFWIVWELFLVIYMINDYADQWVVCCHGNNTLCLKMVRIQEILKYVRIDISLQYWYFSYLVKTKYVYTTHRSNTRRILVNQSHVLSITFSGQGHFVW